METYAWQDASTYVENPPFFEGIRRELPKELSVTAMSDDDSVTEFPRGREHRHPDGGRVRPPWRDPPLPAAPNGGGRLVAFELRPGGNHVASHTSLSAP